MQNSQIRDFTQGNISRQLIKLALPLMATSFIQMTYNLVNILWIGQLGSRSVAAVGSVGMLIWMMNAFALTSKISAEVAVGQSIGAKRTDQAVRYASHTTTIAVILGLSFGILFFSSPATFISFFKLESDIAQEAADYLKIISVGIPLIFLILNFSGIYVGSGRSDIPFYFNASGLILNAVLDPLFIFGPGFFPQMGVKGAALATVISHFIVVILFVRHLRSKKGALGGFPLLTKLRKTQTLNILRLGVPAAMMNVYFSFINMNLARIASIYGGYIGVTTQTTGGQVEGITWNTSQGFATALSSFVAQNYTAGKIIRAQRAYRSTLKWMTVFGIFVSLAFIFTGESIFSLFIPEKLAYQAGGEYLLIMGFSQVFMMIEITTQGMFNGLGRTAPPAIVSMTFNTLRIPLSVFLASQIGITGVWWAITITSIIKGCTSVLWFHFTRKKHFNQYDEIT